jgi:hypothetical protein
MGRHTIRVISLFIFYVGEDSKTYMIPGVLEALTVTVATV